MIFYVDQYKRHHAQETNAKSSLSVLTGAPVSALAPTARAGAAGGQVQVMWWAGDVVGRCR